MARYITVEESLRELDSLAARGLDAREIHAYLLGTLIEPASLEPYVNFRLDRYTRNLAPVFKRTHINFHSQVLVSFS